MSFFLLVTKQSQAAALPSFDFGSILSNPLGFLTPEVANPVVKTMGLIFNHHALEPATALGTGAGLSFAMQADVVQVPESFNTALAGQQINLPNIPVLPNVRMINLHKGLFDWLDIGGSVFLYAGYVVWAVDMKFILLQPEEGLTWAIRLNRNSAHIPVGSTSITVQSVNLTTINLSIDTVTWKPELLVSKRLDFAEPYMGVAFEYVTGTLNVTMDPVIQGANINPVNGSGTNVSAFMGVGFTIPKLAINLGFEGAYSFSGGYNSISSKVGFRF